MNEVGSTSSTRMMIEWTADRKKDQRTHDSLTRGLGIDDAISSLGVLA